MTVTTDETLTANGVVLNTLAYNIGSLTGRLRVPGRRGSNVAVPGRHGAIRVPHKRYGQGEIVLPMWVVGADEDGLVPQAEPLRQQFYANLDKLTRIFAAETVELIHTLPDGSQRRVVGEPSEAMDPSMTGGTRAEFAVALTVSEAFWEDVTDVAASFMGTGTWSVTPFAGATAPMDDLVVTFTGGTNPEIQSGDVWVRYSAELSPSESIYINCADWSLEGAGGLVPDYGALAHGGDARWFVLHPGAGASDVPSAEVSQTGVGSMTTELSGKRKYLVG